MSTKFKIVLIATLFNLSFEFAFRGVAGLRVIPHFFWFLFLFYFAYFSIVEDLIRRYHITNKQLLLVAFCFGLLPETFLTGSAFMPPLVAGLNWYVIFFVNIVWWGFIQGLLTFYLANRLVKRSWNEPFMGKLGWILSVLYLGGIIAINFFHSQTLPRGPKGAYIIVLIMFLGLLIYLKSKLTAPQQPVYEFQKSALLDIVSLAAVIGFLYSGAVLARQAIFDSTSNSVISLASKTFLNRFTAIIFVVMLIYYMVKKKPITI